MWGMGHLFTSQEQEDRLATKIIKHLVCVWYCGQCFKSVAILVHPCLRWESGALRQRAHLQVCACGPEEWANRTWVGAAEWGRRAWGDGLHWGSLIASHGCTVLFLLSTGTSVSKESTWNAGHLALIPGLGRSPGEGNGKPLQYSCWKKRSQSMGSQMWLSNETTTTACTPFLVVQNQE